MQEQLKGVPVEKWEGGTTLSPGVHKGYSPTFIGEKGSENYQVLESHVMHYLTPETATTTHYSWAVSVDFMDQATADLAQPAIATAFDEDAFAVEHMQNLMIHDKVDFQDMNLAADKPGVMLRHRFLEWAKEEYAGL